MEPKKQLMETKKRQLENSTFWRSISGQENNWLHYHRNCESPLFICVFVSNSTENLYTLSELRENANQFTGELPNEDIHE